jgi:long-chain acyl-CoA synthetase
MAKNFKAWPKNFPRSQYYPNRPVFYLLEQTVRRVPNRLALIFAGSEITYSELKDLAERFASALTDLGVGKGDRVAIHLVNCPQFAIAYYGIMRIGAVFTPLSPLLSPREFTYQLNDSGAETLITLDLLYPGISPSLSQTPVKRVISTSLADCFNPLTAPLKPLGKVPVPDTLDMAPLLAQYPPFQGEVSIDPASLHRPR